jgi:hypothetical protein
MERGERTMKPEDGTDRYGAAATDELVEFKFEPVKLQEFTEWLDGELDRLVERWQHLAAPRASRSGRISPWQDR